MVEFLFSRLYYFIRKTNITIVFRRKEMNSSTTNQKWFNRLIYRVLADDEVRNQAYKKAIQQTINKESKVIEIGCGDRAFLSQICINQQPKLFIGIEENITAYKRAKLLLKNEYGDRESIKVIEGNSADLKISPKANVLVQEIIGSIASAEGVALAVSDAKHRYLDPHATFIPSICKTSIIPVAALTLNPLEQLMAKLSCGSVKKPGLYRVFNFPKSALFSNAQVFENLDFSKDIKLKDQKRLKFKLKENTSFSGFLCFLDLEFDSNNQLNSLNEITNWSTPFIKLCKKPLKLKKGTEIEVLIETDLSSLNPSYKLFSKVGNTTLEYSWSGA